jgi:hypothetical protein
VKASLKSRLWVAWARMQNRYMDARARFAGACNADTWTGEGHTGYAGGYSHWRCGKKRGHFGNGVMVYRDGDYVDGGTYGPHRFNNYIWNGPGSRVEYAPLPIRNESNTGWFDTWRVLPFRKLADGRRLVTSRRRGRLQARLHEAHREARRIEREQESDGAGL